MQKIINTMDVITDITGKLVAWLTLALILTTCAVVVMRYFLNTGSLALQETVTYFHAAIFMLGIGYTLKQGGHVRVDVFYRKLTPRNQALVDVLGGVFFLLPVSILILALSWDYVANSWAIRETSVDGGGLPYVYALKTLILLLPATLIIQGLAEVLKNLLFFLNKGGAHTAEKLESL